MSKYICNPLNVEYRYQFHDTFHPSGERQISREAADPSLILFHGIYYMFVSMCLEVWVSEDLAEWTQHRLPNDLPLYDYAPDVRVIGEYVYFSASKRDDICDFYRTKDILNGPYEKINGTFPFWDPNLFCDDDGRVYFFWGCSNQTPIQGVELDPVTMKPLTKPRELISDHTDILGYERFGEDNSLEAYDENGIENARPYIEGAWMTKYHDTYYLQYACPGTEFNIYADGVYVGKTPLGPFSPARNNPYSLKPGGFINGAGHGSTLKDSFDNYWHAATMRISKNHIFERRVGIWPAGFDEEGDLYCDQRFGDWPMKIEQGRVTPWEDPDWYLLSYNKPVRASSQVKGYEPHLAVNEDVQTWWKAETNQPGEWIEIDLGDDREVHAIQINFADDKMDAALPGDLRGKDSIRYIDEGKHVTRWYLEGSLDGLHYFKLKDMSDTETNLPHYFFTLEDKLQIKYLRLTVLEVPFEQNACVSGIRVFGHGHGTPPREPQYQVKRIDDRCMEVRMNHSSEVTGYSIVWGYRPDKLYHSRMTFADVQRIASLIKNEDVYVRVDAFNENGLTKGTEIIRV